MTTQIELVESDPVLRPVAEKYHLLDLENQFRWLNEAKAGGFATPQSFLNG